MTAEQAILAFGAITLTGCGTGLVIIHEKNPLLKGLHWMGMALVAGGLGAAFTLGGMRWNVLQPLSCTLVLLTFLACNRADLYLLGVETKIARLAWLLVGCQAVTVLLQWAGWIHARNGLAISSGLIAVQIATNARLVRRHATGRDRPPARFTAILLRVFFTAAIARGVWSAAGFLEGARWSASLNLLIYCTSIASAIVIAFTFFWRTTTKLGAELEHMASTDPLTRVYNRRVFLTWCEREQIRHQQLHAPFSVLMVDFDHFKRVNDTFGHHAGDQVLCAAVERIQDSIRGIDVLCRWGGEEFTVLLPNASEEATLIVAERVRRNIRMIASADPRFAEVAFSELQLTASIGTATFDGDGDSFQLMLQRADEALYEAKRAGRDRVMRSVRAKPERVAFTTPGLTLRLP